ncbi:hypothetical protein GQ44DRAFT_487363 [Phaeosphaeriaceae sp. PMI808]|nr:hypothetical protein GQ44DRAFT_487363 [Phaeosphaeriaceae sp. PMI808]
MLRTREYLRPQFEDTDSLDIIVRVYSNLEGMANYLVRMDKVRNLGQLRAFSTGFCGRISTFDWVDTGVGKEGGAGRKVKGKPKSPIRPSIHPSIHPQRPRKFTHTPAENLSFYTSNTHLRHVLIACSPLDLPPSLLTTLPLSKITLIESIPLPPSLTTLPLKIAKFYSIFTPPPPLKSPKPSNRGRNAPQLQLMQQEDDGGGSTWLVIQPDRNERSKSQGAALRRGKGNSDDDTASLSISIGPDNTVSVDSGRRRRLM